jgi:hypothetical protein
MEWCIGTIAKAPRNKHVNVEPALDLRPDMIW